MFPTRLSIPISRQVRSDCYLVQRRHFYNKYKHGPQKITNRDPPYEKWISEILSEPKKAFIEAHRKLWEIAAEALKWKHYVPPKPDELNIIEEFDSEEAIKRWKPVADSDSLNGFSESRIVRSPAGHALFTGLIDNRLPDDGMTMRSGFAGIIGPTAPLIYPFQKETHWDWRHYNCMEVKFRGDGRTYQLVINTGTYHSDQEYYDHHSYFLHTRGGPYWQTVRIPFHKFVFNFKNFIQDRQYGLRKLRVKFVAFNIQDSVDGPFALEIDHIGLINQSGPLDIRTAYEGYRYAHLRYKSLEVDSPVPERE